MHKHSSHIRFNKLLLNMVNAHDGIGEVFVRRNLSLSANSSYNFIDAVVIPKGSSIGIHTHQKNNEEIYIIISGHGLMHLDGHEFKVKRGDVIVNRPGGAHGLKNIGTKEIKLIVIEIKYSA